jgi:hypothetical protein
VLRTQRFFLALRSHKKKNKKKKNKKNAGLLQEEGPFCKKC